MIELSPGQDIALADAEGAPLGRIRMGVGWDKNRTSGAIGTGAPDIDLDATAIEFRDGALFDIAFYNNLATRDGAVVHAGDNQTGRGDGDDESVDIDLAKVHAPVDTIVLLVSSYQGHTLEWVGHAYCRILDDASAELARLTLTNGVPQTGLVMARLVRDPASGGWRLHAIGEGVAITVPTEGLAKLRPFL